MTKSSNLVLLAAIAAILGSSIEGSFSRDFIDQKFLILLSSTLGAFIAFFSARKKPTLQILTVIVFLWTGVVWNNLLLPKIFSLFIGEYSSQMVENIREFTPVVLSIILVISLLLNANKEDKDLPET